MRTKYILLIPVFNLLSLLTLSGQQVYQLKHYGSPGTIYLYNPVPGMIPTPEIIAAGDSIIWDVSANATLNTNPTQIVTPSQAIDQFTFLTICSLSGLNIFTCGAIWSQTEQVLLTQDSLDLFGFGLNDLQRYQNKTGNYLLENFFGFTVDLGGGGANAVIVYQQPDTIFQFPLQYGASWSSDINWMVDLSITGQNIMYESHQVRTAEVDAWGTLYTPFDTFYNVVRVRAEILHQDTLTADSVSIPVDLTQVEYMWFDTSYKLPVMVAIGFKNDSLELINTVQYIYEATCAVPTWIASAGSDVFYLDESGSVVVDFQIDASNANVYTWDFGDGTVVTTAGTVSHEFNAAGNVSVEVSGCMTNCLPLNSCSVQIIDFEILDTLSSVKIIPGEELNIKLYPNPANKEINIEIPPDLHFTAYRILDITGRVILSGSLKGLVSTIPVNKLQHGVYTVHLNGTGASGRSESVMRFAVYE